MIRHALRLSLALAAAPAWASNYYWDADSVSADGASAGGSGAWAVGSSGWEDGAAAVNWANGNTAVLGGAGGTLTLGGAVTAAGVTVGAGDYVVDGAQTLAAGALSVAAGASLTLTNGASAASWTNLTGSGTLVINKPNNMDITAAFNTAGGLAFTGLLQLRGSGWLTLGGSSLSQAAGTSFALDTGASSASKKDLIVTDGFNGKTLTLNSLTGYGGIRVDWGVTGTRGILVDQPTNTTFNGTIAAHDSSSDRSIAFRKAGAGTLTLAGALSDGVQAPLSVTVTNGTLVATANNATRGPLVICTNAVLKMQNANAGTGFTGGNSSMSGSYLVDAGGALMGIRNGTAAFGTGAIVLNGGTLAQWDGNWTWANNIVLSNGVTSTLESQSSNTGTRALKLQGVVSGGGDLTFSDTSNGMGLDTGFIFAGSNTLSGTVTIPAGRKVRVGGVQGSDASLAAGTGGTLGTAAIVNHGTLTLSRSDAHIFSNAVSGTGAVRIGSTGIAGSETQVVAVAGNNTYKGATSVNVGALLVNGSHTGGSLYTVATNAVLGGCGSISVAAGGAVTLEAGASLAPGEAPNAGGTLTLNTLTLSGGAQIVVDATNDLAVVTGDLALSSNAVFIANASALKTAATYPFLVGLGTVTGTLPTRVEGTHWFIRRNGNTFYLQYNFGTVVTLH